MAKKTSSPCCGCQAENEHLRQEVRLLEESLARAERDRAREMRERDGALKAALWVVGLILFAMLLSLLLGS